MTKKIQWKRFEVLNVSIGRPTKSEDKDKMPKNTDKIKKLNKSEREELVRIKTKKWISWSRNTLFKKARCLN